MKRNPNHYSALFRFLGADLTNQFHKYGCNHVYFNTNVQTIHAGRIKYGIAERADVMRDLLEWNELYVAGRMHKPVQWRYSDGQTPIGEEGYPQYLDVDAMEERWIGKGQTFTDEARDNLNENTQADEPLSSTWNDNILPDPKLDQACRVNRRRALLFAILFSLPPSSNAHKHYSLEWNQLYEQICRLSYDGDVRMRLKAENAHKIQNIAHGQRAYFDAIYRDGIVANELHHGSFDERVLSLSLEEWRNFLVEAGVPQQVITIQRQLEPSHTHLHLENALNLANSSHLRGNVAEIQRLTKKSVEKIVFDSSKSQLIKGFFTAGTTTSIKYAWKKMMKSFWSRR
uniref:Phosphatidate cytidylyltransferase, mitochondrial n=1 Tax=Percolomonas cosmopolitus TaxID=63605 RepID=A0A7S1KR46_9EUKA